MPEVKVFTDGASRGNPGLAGAGAFISIPSPALAASDKNLQIHLSSYLGEKTNNQAEYLAILLALKWLKNHESELVSSAKIVFFLDSQLVVNQLNKTWKIKSSNLKTTAKQCWGLLHQISKQVEITHIPRQKNEKADCLANQAIDLHLG